MMETPVAPEQVGLSRERLGRVRRWMREQVERERLPGASVLIARHGRVAFFECEGQRDIEAGAPVQRDTLFRVFSMTKPLTTVALMMLYEAGAFQLDDPVARYLPEFEDMQVLVGGSAQAPRLKPADGPITIHHLLTHTAGLTYWFMGDSPVSGMYRNAGIDFVRGEGGLAEMVERVAAQPLIDHPGARWHYSVATDVLGRLVEVLSGERFDVFLQRHVLAPLGMHDTGFEVADRDIDRLAALYGPPGSDGLLAGDGGDMPMPDGGLELLEAPASSAFRAPVSLHSGGGGLISTAPDYLRYCRMMLGGGEVDGVRLLGRKTVELMTTNQLPGDLASMGQPVFSETRYDGIGFGLGVSVTLDPVRARILGSPGEFAWGGVASTAFWVDPREDMAVIFLTQLMPSWSYPLRQQLRVLTYQALVS
ncbi:beta-lactamase family protein [Arhodomonas aquaeolei]|uniref:serine hydrolase domain-containing protein n=1 Tax=Arhodomonas aquaeolei TaxID=2369 RepID=UPI000363649F|nr:serine hydrolase domain-containing protein [Arhodomonas aquaeolei]MCS4502530.1 beta-lactamase family protein [Arhodomonas aquaeolei]